MASEMRVIWVTEPLVNNGFVVKETVDGKLAAKVAKLLVELDSGEKEKSQPMAAEPIMAAPPIAQVPKPISLTSKSVFPNFRYCIPQFTML